MVEGFDMNHGESWDRLFFIFFAIGLAPAVPAQAQPVHLGALQAWMDKTEEAAKYLSRGDYVQAEERLNLAIKDIRPYLPETRNIMARSYCELARVLYHQKRYADAEPLARWALSVREADTKAQPDAVFQCVYTFALIQSGQKKNEEAEQLFKRSLELQEKNLGKGHINTILILHQLAVVCIAQGKFTDAESLYLRAIAIHERKSPDENLDLAETADLYAELLRRMRRHDDADRWHARALAIRDIVATKAANAKADQVAQQFKGYK
jgi:tetratricopeptide (TPR) repeat protein